MPALFYPPADRRAQWFGDRYPGTVMRGVDKLLLHTTETSGWPAYDGGAKAPTMTYHPRLHRWRQHFRITQSARALRDPSSTPVRENRDNVVQVEICCSCSRTWADKYHVQHVTELDDQALSDLGQFAGWLHAEWGLPLKPAPLWPAYPASGRSDSPARMSSAAYDKFAGVLGHMHASGNDHGDPGAIDIDHIIATAIRVTNPAPKPAKDDDMAATADQVLAELRAFIEVERQRYTVDADRYKTESDRWAQEVARDNKTALALTELSVNVKALAAALGKGDA